MQFWLLGMGSLLAGTAFVLQAVMLVVQALRWAPLLVVTTADSGIRLSV
ncbi:hypothetical protein [Demequina rhizosphaerae]|nr:hypothetical protein [Demequina rhizosphaerae]